MSLYDDNLDIRMERLQDALQGKDPEGVVTVFSSDLIELISSFNLLKNASQHLQRQLDKIYPRD